MQSGDSRNRARRRNRRRNCRKFPCRRECVARVAGSGNPRRRTIGNRRGAWTDTTSDAERPSVVRRRQRAVRATIRIVGELCRSLPTTCASRQAVEKPRGRDARRVQQSAAPMPITALRARARCPARHRCTALRCRAASRRAAARARGAWSAPHPWHRSDGRAQSRRPRR